MGTVEIPRLLGGTLEQCGGSFAACGFGGQVVYSSKREAGRLTDATQQVDDRDGSGTDKLDDKIKQLLRDLGTAINESISGSDDVNRHIQKIRDEGYDLYVVLDATIGLNKEDEPQSEVPAVVMVKSDKEIQFRININDLALLRALGIDPTRKVRTS